MTVRSDERRGWEREAVRITERALDRGDSAAVDIFLVLADSIEDQRLQVLPRLTSKAVELLQKPGRRTDSADLDRLAGLLESGLSTAASDDEAERFSRQILELRRQIPAGLQKLQQAIERLADILARKGFDLRRHGNPGTAIPVLREALKLLMELGNNSGAYTRARLLDLESELAACLFETGDFDQAEPLLRRAYDELKNTEGMKSSATQTVLRRLIDLYERRGSSGEVASYRREQPVIAFADVRDLGALRLPGAHSKWDVGRSVAWSQRSARMFWTESGSAPVFRPAAAPATATLMSWADDSVEFGTGLQDESSLENGFPRINETDAGFPRMNLLPLTDDESAFNTQSLGAACGNACGSRWVLSPRSVVADPARQRALVLYSKSQRGSRDASKEAGVSLAIWRTLARPWNVRSCGRQPGTDAAVWSG